MRMIDFTQPTAASTIHGAEYPDDPNNYLWRVTSTYFLDEDSLTPKVSVFFDRWFILRATPKGAWVVPMELSNARFDYQKSRAESVKKLVIHGTRKAWAYPTKVLAWSSFLRRQDHRVFYARQALEAAEAIREFALTVDKDALKGGE